jgi:hypothetical protein
MFDEIVTLWTHIDMKRKMKFFLSPIDEVYTVAAFLTNLHGLVSNSTNANSTASNTTTQSTPPSCQHNCDCDRVDDHHCNDVVKIDITMNTINTTIHTNNTPQNHNEIFYQLLS